MREALMMSLTRPRPSRPHTPPQSGRRGTRGSSTPGCRWTAGHHKRPPARPDPQDPWDLAPHRFPQKIQMGNHTPGPPFPESRFLHSDRDSRHTGQLERERNKRLLIRATVGVGKIIDFFFFLRSKSRDHLSRTPTSPGPTSLTNSVQFPFTEVPRSPSRVPVSGATTANTVPA